MKKILFTAVLVLTPILLIGLVEVVLEWADYGGNLSFVSRTTVGGRPMDVLNRRLGLRYFAGSPVAVPEPTEEFLPPAEDTTVRRIFCLGESTMQGFPYEYGATAPGFLEERLSAMFPGERIDVVNAGLSAVGSFVVLDLMRDVRALRPDLIVIYLGHNEFYGAYGAGSTVGASGHSWMTRLSLRLLRFRTFLALRDLVVSIRTSTGGTAIPGSLMGQMAAERAIPLYSGLYDQARVTYRENLERIADEAERAGIPLMFCALVSNLRDQPPFVSLHTPDLTEEERTATLSAITRAGERSAAGAQSAAEEILKTALTSDSLYALLHYRLGRILADRGDTLGALTHLQRARDLDGLRFRATGDFQSVLAGVCAGRGIPLARIDSAFAAASPGGAPGYSLILEHLHPNLDGYFLMAREICATMERHALVFTPEQWRGARRPTDAGLRERSAATDFDRTMGGIKVYLLMQRWPFSRDGGTPAFTPADGFDDIVYRYVRGTIAWSEARYAAAAWFGTAGQYDRARRECRAVARVIPFSYYPVFQEGEYWRQEGRPAEAEEAYRRSIAVEENPFARMKLAIMSMESGRPAAAIPEIVQALQGGAGQGTQLSTSARATALYLLGGAKAQTGDLQGALRQLEESLALEPGNADAVALREQVRSALGRGGAQ